MNKLTSLLFTILIVSACQQEKINLGFLNTESYSYSIISEQGKSVQTDIPGFYFEIEDTASIFYYNFDKKTPLSRQWFIQLDSTETDSMFYDQLIYYPDFQSICYDDDITYFTFKNRLFKYKYDEELHRVFIGYEYPTD